LDTENPKQKGAFRRLPTEGTDLIKVTGETTFHVAVINAPACTAV
tara:strand:+ start:139043 stop:139177 length:135 start_codon:yes stop_codon:yes gene_type:complete